MHPFSSIGGAYDELLDQDGRVTPEWRAYIPPAEPATSRAIQDRGVLAG
jgi:aminoglycoside 3-N-acetyltransferase